jgi:hypothetical protein
MRCARGPVQRRDARVDGVDHRERDGDLLTSRRRQRQLLKPRAVLAGEQNRTHWQPVVIQHRLHPLRPLAALINERVAQPDPGAQIKDVIGRDPHSGNRPAINSSRRCRASARSFFACCLLPRSALVSAASARCTPLLTRRSSSTTNRQPIVASNATSSSRPSNRPKNLRTPWRSAGTIRARETSPVSVSSHSPVICERC